MYAGSGSPRLDRKFYLILILILRHFSLDSFHFILISLDFTFTFLLNCKWKTITNKNKK